MRCDVDRCAATYKSFNAADCTYQPYGGGPRSFCGPGDRSGETRQTLRTAAEPGAEATDTQLADLPKSARPAPMGAQCNPARCAAMYKTFNAADCTYEPFGGGPRRICER